MKIQSIVIKAIAAFLLAATVAGCHGPASDTALIEGGLTDAKGFRLVLAEMETRQIHPVDSVSLDGTGRFTFRPVVREPGFWLLKAPSGKVLVLVLGPGDHLTVSGSAVDFPNRTTLSGPSETMAVDSFYKATRKHEARVDSLEALLLSRQDSADFLTLSQHVDTILGEILIAQRARETGFLTAHPGSIGSLLVLNYAFGPQPVLDPKNDVVWYQRVDSALYCRWPNNKHVAAHHKRMLQSAGLK